MLGYYVCLISNGFGWLRRTEVNIQWMLIPVCVRPGGGRRIQRDTKSFLSGDAVSQKGLNSNIYCAIFDGCYCSFWGQIRVLMHARYTACHNTVSHTPRLLHKRDVGGCDEHRRRSNLSGNRPRMKTWDSHGEEVISHLGPEDGLEIYHSVKWKDLNNLRKYCPI